MRPLLYLTWRSFANGVRRALTSPRRLIGLLAFGAYYFMFFIRGFDNGRPRAFGPSAGLSFPPLQVLEAVAFGLFAGLSLFLAVSMFGYRASFKPADVDVLFPTPVEPKIVLVFRIFRDYLFTLLIPLLFALITWRPTTAGLDRLFRDLPNPESAGSVGRAVTVAWILMALTWVCIGYAASLFVDRSDLKSDRNRWIIVIGIGGTLLATGIYVALNLRDYTGTEDLLALAQSPVLRTVFFTATAATALVMAPLEGSWLHAVLGIGGMLAIIALALKIALSQVPWMYDQAAVRGFSTAESKALQRKGDAVAIAALRARSRGSKSRRWRWFHELKLTGPAALLWKDALLQVRSLFWIPVIFALFVGFMTWLQTLAGAGQARTAAAFFLTMQAFGTFFCAVTVTQGGMIETLRRVDLQKPLPFSAATIVFAEVSAKALPSVLVAWVGSLLGLILQPNLGLWLLAGALGMPFFALTVCATVFLVTVTFPDIEDPTQRGFRGFMTMLGLAVLAMPPFLVATILMSLNVHALIVTAAFSLINLAVAVGATAAGGALYAGYNPSE